MERRTFVKLSAYTAIVLALPFAEGCSDGTGTAASQPWLFSHIVDAKTISEAGQAYRKLVPAEDDKAGLEKLLLGSNPSADKKQIQQMLDSRVVDDFKSDKTVTVSGWVLSVTEARQCALFSILNS
ncbi:MAG: hypothetical protein JST19_10395 [Bacteroidetes bacterium]|nr:hypothetical protein [Bacteroidota bacterium]